MGNWEIWEHPHVHTPWCGPHSFSPSSNATVLADRMVLLNRLLNGHQGSSRERATFSWKQKNRTRIGRCSKHASLVTCEVSETVLAKNLKWGEEQGAFFPGQPFLDHKQRKTGVYLSCNLLRQKTIIANGSRALPLQTDLPCHVPLTSASTLIPAPEVYNERHSNICIQMASVLIY